MDYEITTTEFTNQTYEFKDLKPNNHNVKRGNFDINFLSGSKIDSTVLKIPKNNQLELNKKGETKFTILTYQEVVIKAQKAII